MWNICVKLDKERYQEANKFIYRSEFQHLLKNSVEGLSVKNIQHVMIKYLSARDAMFRSMKANHKNSSKVKLPYKNKKYFNSGWDSQSIKADYENGFILLSKSMLKISDNKTKRQNPVRCKVKDIPNNIVEIELIWKEKLYLVIKYKEEASYMQINSDNSASIDLGEINIITSIDNNKNALIITGRQVRSFKRYRNKELGKIKSKLSKCTKGSRNYKRYNKALNKLKYKTERKINDSVHKITKHYVDYCIMNDIKVVYYGDLDSCVRSTKENNIASKKVRQKLSQWNFGQVVMQLENKLNRHGIYMIKIQEYYTSQKCPNCTNLNKPKGRNYVCKCCGYTQHRDIVGAINILNDNHNTIIKRYSNLKYLQIA